MTGTEILVISTVSITTAVAVIGVVVAVTVCVTYVCNPRNSQVVPQQVSEVVNGVARVPNGNEQVVNVVAQVPNGNEQVVNGMARVPNGNEQAPEVPNEVVEVVRVFDDRFFSQSPFEPPLMNPTYFNLVSAILIFFVVSLLIKNMRGTNRFV